MIEVLEEFWNELTEGDIHARDNLQFELKSEFFIHPDIENNVYKQNFYLFVPNPLQINENTYSSEQFYLDQTTLIRYKTPLFTLAELTQNDNLKSPLARLQLSLNAPLEETKEMADELKLFANIFKVALRNQIRELISKWNRDREKINPFYERTATLCSEIKNVRIAFLDIQQKFFQYHPKKKEIINHFHYTDEYVSQTIDYYLTALLKALKEESDLEIDQRIHHLLCDLILKEEEHRKRFNLEPSHKKDEIQANEAILYRSSLLNKFMLEALLLNSNRQSLQDKQQHLLGALTAGVAMLVYMALFILTWHSSLFVADSMAFIAVVVTFYILKDRLKEGLKALYYKQASRWFPDYSTRIVNRKGCVIGELEENFSFIQEDQLPHEFAEMRNKDFHEELPDFKRQETIIHYRREVFLKRQPASFESRRKELTTIFRLNISCFLQKASNALQPNLILDKSTLNIIERLLPRIYHINIIILNTYLQANLQTKSEVKKFRVVIDKFGIKRVEQIK